MAWSTGAWPYSRFDDAPFDAAVWRTHAQDASPLNPRGPMLADLRERLLKPGLSAMTTAALLGGPDVEASPWLWCYALGNWSGYRDRPDALWLHFDGAGRLTLAELGRR